MRAILLASGLSLIISLLGTRIAIRRFTELGYGQEIRDDGPTSHHTKRGTPTMGGVVIIAASVLGYAAALLITVVRQTNGDGHAVLTVTSNRGDLVLDNLDPQVKLWSETSYRYLKRQSQYDSGLWVAIEDGRSQQLVGSLR